MTHKNRKTAVVTGSGGLIGSEASRRLVHDGYHVVGIDNDMRRVFFGPDGSTTALSTSLADELGRDFSWRRVDIRDDVVIDDIFRETVPEIVVHCAAQPAHDKAAEDPRLDFSVNAVGTLNLLEATRLYAFDATFLHVSTSKVYGDNPNRLPLERRATRWDLPVDHPYYYGIDTSMSIDQCLHSLFGASKASADLLAQEFGKYWGMKVGVFRPGCLTGGDHAGVELHGFLSYLMKRVMSGTEYKIFGYEGGQVRCNLHAKDLTSAFMEFHARPQCGIVYNIGGGRENACSMIEAVEMCEQVAGRKAVLQYVDEPRIGDHQFWISSNKDFSLDYPGWRPEVDLPMILEEIHEKSR